MTVGAIFLIPSLSSLPSSLLPLSPLPPLFPVSSLSCSSHIFLSPSVVPYLYPLDTARESGECCKLSSGSRQGQAAKRFWCILRMNSAHILSNRLILLIQKMDKIPLVAIWEASPPQLFGRGAIATMESGQVVHTHVPL